MSWKDFFETVEEMRKAQKEYFKTRGFEELTRSKALEQAVDSLIERHKSKQQEMFKGMGKDTPESLGKIILEINKRSHSNENI